MKNIVKLLLTAAIAYSGVSCENFLDAQPISQISADAFFVREMDFKLYCTGMLDNYCPSASTVGMGDNYTDLTASKSSTDYYKPGAAWDASKQTGWAASNWRGIRRANIMLRDMVRAKENVSEEVYNHYEGVARFWRAYFYYDKVQSFGNVPWIDHPLDIDDALLYAGRDDREYVMSKVLEDLNFAGEHCFPVGENDCKGSEITKWAVLAFKSRVCLYEGTFRKYHSVNPSTNQPWNNQYGTADDFLQAAVDAAEEVMKDSGSTLYNDYHSLFVSTDLSQIPEVLWYREYLSSESLNVWHDLTLQYNTATASQKVSPTKTLMNMYLNTDGTPITNNGEVSLNDEFTDRDPRMAATVQCPGHQWTMAGVTGPKPLRFTWTVTGYMFTKWNQELEENYINGRNDNWIPILRYGEVLLNYAEAKAELNNGSLSKDDWDKTVGALRTRAGVTNIYPEDASYKEDTWLKGYYAKAEGAAVTNLSNTILEIRRERVTELILEGLRADDLYRWHCANLIVDRDGQQNGWKGLYLTADDVKNGFEFNGEKFTFTSSGTNDNNYMVGTNTSDNNWTISGGDHGYLIYHQALIWDEKRYIRPIPTSALNRYTYRGQNYGWGQ